eukprot:COSAG06_NODE_23837_length_680_cov_0.881239_1_plen_62_part_10
MRGAPGRTGGAGHGVEERGLDVALVVQVDRAGQGLLHPVLELLSLLLVILQVELVAQVIEAR